VCLEISMSITLTYMYIHKHLSATLTVPPVSVVITPVGTPVAGQSYSLSCSVHGADSLSPTSTTYHWYNESNNSRSLVATTNVYTLTRLQTYHDGNYTCEVTVVSPYLNGDFNQSATQEIVVESKLCSFQNNRNLSHWSTEEN